MSDFLALSGIIAIWLVVGLMLRLARRLWIWSRQTRRLRHAAGAVELAEGANAVFDTIRTPSAPETAPSDLRGYLLRETHALLNRIQQQGAYFDQVNSLRVNIQAVIGVDDHKGLSDILDLRRDLWAASEIVLVEDPAQFGQTFADEGAFERFRAEAVRTLFKLPELVGAGEDVIDLRIALAVQEAERFAADLSAAIAEARERDRLPTPSELAAYPVAWVKKIPVMLAAAARFVKAFYAHASELSRRIRSSETVTRGTARMRQIGEDWPQRLSDGFQRATEAARENASSLREHYDFLAAAHDFKGKYQKLIQRAPELSDRSRQFIARLELAERSERLRLTSANAAIWTLRKAVDGLAHMIAFLRNLHAGMQGTAPYALVLAALAPAPVRGRRVPAFRSYHRALAMNHMREPVSGPVILIEEDRIAVAPAKRGTSAETKRSGGKSAKRQGAHKPAEKRPAKQEKVIAAKPAAKAAKTAARKPEKTVAAKRTARPPAGKSSEGRRTLFGLFGRQAGDVKAAEPAKTRPLRTKSAPRTEGIAQKPVEISKTPAAVKPARKRRGLFGLFSGKAKTEKPLQAAKARAAKPKPEARMEKAIEQTQSVQPAATAAKLPPKPEIRASKEEAKPVEPLRREEKPAAPVIAAVEKPEKPIEAAVPEAPEATAAIAGDLSAEPPAAGAGKETGFGPANGTASATLRDEEPVSAPVAAPPAAETASAISAGKGVTESGNADAEAPKRGSFLGRLFGGRKAGRDQQDIPSKDEIGGWPSYEEAMASTIADPDLDDRIEPPASLLDKLSSLDEAGDSKAFEPSIESEPDSQAEPPANGAQTRGEEDEFGPLTQSLMELQGKMKPSAPQIKAFPWLRQ